MDQNLKLIKAVYSQLDSYCIFRGDMLYKKQQKSNHWVVIPLRPEALAILKERFKKGHISISNLILAYIYCLKVC